MPEVVPGTLAEALAALQGQLPHVAKTADGQERTEEEGRA